MLSGQDKFKIEKIFFFTCFILLIILGFFLFKPFFNLIFLSILIVIILYPQHLKIKEELERDSLSAFFSTLFIVVFVIVPVTSLLFIVSAQLFELLPSINELVTANGEIKFPFKNIPWLNQLYERLSVYLAEFEAQYDVTTVIRNAAGSVAAYLLDQGKNAFLSITALIVNIALMMLTIFFLFRDGEALYKTVYGIIPMADNDKDLLFSKTLDAIHGIIMGTFITALAQAALGFIGYLVLGLKFSYFWAFLTFFASFIPIGGAAIIWGPIAIFALFSKGIIPGLLFALWGTFGISMVDNIIRPYVIGDKTNIHPMILLFGILGGLTIFGFFGVFIAPIIIVLLKNFTYIYKQKYILGTNVIQSNDLMEEK